MSLNDGRERRVSAHDVDDDRAHILHVDMDAFFVNVSLLSSPELRGKPVIIGHDSRRSVVSSASYEARRFGVTSAMPVARALTLCPSAIVVPPDFPAYRAASDRVMAICASTTPLVEPVSIDEAFLDVAGVRRLSGSPGSIARELKARIERETGLPCSVGVAATKFVAKLASGLAKPDGVLVVPVDDTVEFLQPLPIRRLWGVGPRTAEHLSARAIRTIGDVAATPHAVLARIVGDAVATRLGELARGIDARHVETEREEKSISHEQTFVGDVTDPSVIERTILKLSERLATRLRAAGVSASGVAVKLRYEDFRTQTKGASLPEPTDVGQRISDTARRLVDENWDRSHAVRLIGVRVERFNAPDGSALLWDPDENWRDAETTLDALRGRFGPDAISRASLLGHE